MTSHRVPENIARLGEEARHISAGCGINSEDVVASIYNRAERIAADAVHAGVPSRRAVDSLDDLLTSWWFGFPIMLLLLTAVFWVTVSGANYLSAGLARVLFAGQDILTSIFNRLNAPALLHGVLIMGTYRSVAWVVSVMLPPMAIFFPCFTLLEDLGYLPRVAFNLDPLFDLVGAHGKQSLTMSMGLGCNAAGVIACRIIESPRERLIAIVTNNYVPCNGRFPCLIALSSVCMAWYSGMDPEGAAGSLMASLIVSGMVVLGVVVTLGISWILSRTLLRGIPTSFTLELPPYRPPQIGRVLFTSFIDRTIFVLGRAVTVAAPAGALVWMLANMRVAGTTPIRWAAAFLDPAAKWMGLDGMILVAFLLGLPANEIVLPVAFMGYTGASAMVDAGDIAEMAAVLRVNGWTWVTALCTVLFSLLHFPCATTLLTIFKETGRARWAIATALITTATAAVACFLARAALTGSFSPF